MCRALFSLTNFIFPTYREDFHHNNNYPSLLCRTGWSHEAELNNTFRFTGFSLVRERGSIIAILENCRFIRMFRMWNFNVKNDEIDLHFDMEELKSTLLWPKGDDTKCVWNFQYRRSNFPTFVNIKL